MRPEGDDKWGCGKWVTCGCGGCLLLILVGVAITLAVGGFAVNTMKKSDIYQGAIDRAKENPEVAQRLGEPIEAGFMVSGSISTTGPTGEADIAIPISGPEGRGTIYVVATKNAGQWQYSVLEVAFEGSEDRVDLLAGSLPKQLEEYEPAVDV